MLEASGQGQGNAALPVLCSMPACSLQAWAARSRCLTMLVLTMLSETVSCGAGILVGTLGMAGYREAIDMVRRIVRSAGKKTYTMLMGKPSPPKLANFPEVEVGWVAGTLQTAAAEVCRARPEDANQAGRDEAACWLRACHLAARRSCQQHCSTTALCRPCCRLWCAAGVSVGDDPCHPAALSHLPSIAAAGSAACAACRCGCWWLTRRA